VATTKKPAKNQKKAKSAKTAPKKAKSAKTKPMKMASAPVSKSTLDWSKQFQPLRDGLVVIEIEPPKTTASGLILVSTEQGASRRAKVVAVGEGIKDKKGKIRRLDVQVGDVVLLTPYGGTDVTVGQQQAWIVREEDVLGIET
jgi:chaperonin GroES